MKIGRHLQCGKCSSHSVHVGNNLLTASNLGRANPKFLQLVKHINITQIPARQHRFWATVGWDDIQGPMASMHPSRHPTSTNQRCLWHKFYSSTPTFFLYFFSIIRLQCYSELALVAPLKHSSLLGRNLIPRNVLDSATCFSTSNFHNNTGNILAWRRATYKFLAIVYSL